jgi:hypothetical protein
MNTGILKVLEFSEIFKPEAIRICFISCCNFAIVEFPESAFKRFFAYCFYILESVFGVITFDEIFQKE